MIKQYILILWLFIAGVLAWVEMGLSLARGDIVLFLIFAGLVLTSAMLIVEVVDRYG